MGYVPVSIHITLTYLACIDKVKKKFPWYKRMNSLYRESPVVDRSAVANSTSQLDLTILDHSQVADNDGAATDDDIPIDWPASPGRPGESDEFAKDDDGSSIIITPPPSPSRKPVTPASHAKSEPPPSVRRGGNQKRKSMHSHIEDLTTSLSEARVSCSSPKTSWNLDGDHTNPHPPAVGLQFQQ